MRFADFLQQHFNAGERGHGVIAWVLGVVPAMLLAALAYYLLHRLSPLLALAFNVAILYVTMGFRQVGHYFTDIHWALKSGDLGQARAILGQWRGASCERLNAEEVARLTIEEALVASYQHVFAVVFWFVLLPGPIGAILYRMSVIPAPALGRRRRRRTRCIRQLRRPGVPAARLGAGAADRDRLCRRRRFRGRGLLLAHAGGEMARSLARRRACQRRRRHGRAPGHAFSFGTEPVDRPDLGLGEDADVGFLDSTIGLVWRALVVILFILLLLAISRALS